MASAPDLRDAPVQQRVFSEPPSSAAPVVKSAGRVLRILEYFDDVRRPAAAAEIAHFFNFPQSSTSQLLRSMLSSGYLEFDRDTRLYSPSMRVSLLGSWCHNRLVGEGSLLRMMKRMNQRTGRAVFLAGQVAHQANYILVYQSLMEGRPHLTLGTSRPLSTSGAGIALMSMMTDAEATRFVLRNNADRGEDKQPASVRGVLTMLAEVRRDGFVSFLDVSIAAGVLAAPLSQRPGQPRIAICLGDHIDCFSRDRAMLEPIFLEEIARYEREASGEPAPLLELVNGSS